MEIASAFQRRGLLYVLSSPSGAGKSTIARMLMASDDGVAMSISATTRPIRPGEVDGRDYHFVSDAAFDEMVAGGAFLEWAHVFGHRYGTLKSEVIKVIEEFRRPGRSFLMPGIHVPLNGNTTVEISHESLMRIWTITRFLRQR